ncbi:MAG: hypothetical protein ABW292_22115, partial [Vicinamibacterales bacterium]
MGQQRHDAARAAEAVRPAHLDDRRRARGSEEARNDVDRRGRRLFADELITAAIDGKTKFSSSDTQVGNYDQTWLSDRVWDNRTSLIVDPPDGRIPAP